MQRPTAKTAWKSADQRFFQLRGRFDDGLALEAHHGHALRRTGGLDGELGRGEDERAAIRGADNDLFLVHRSDYLQHLKELEKLYTMLRDVNALVASIPGRGMVPVVRAFSQYCKETGDEILAGLGLSERMSQEETDAALHALMENELLSLRDAGASLELEQSAKLCGNLLVGVLYGN